MPNPPATSGPARDIRRRQRGLALLLVLWTVLLLALVAGSLLKATRTDVDLARNLLRGTQAELLAEGATAMVAKGLLVGEEDLWVSDGSIYAWRDESTAAELRVRITQEVGRIDLNGASAGLLARLLIAAGLVRDEAEALAAAIADFRDPDHERRPNGAEDRPIWSSASPWARRTPPSICRKSCCGFRV